MEVSRAWMYMLLQSAIVITYGCRSDTNAGQEPSANAGIGGATTSCDGSVSGPSGDTAPITGGGTVSDTAGGATITFGGQIQCNGGGPTVSGSGGCTKPNAGSSTGAELAGGISSVTSATDTRSGRTVEGGTNTSGSNGWTAATAMGGTGTVADSRANGGTDSSGSNSVGETTMSDSSMGGGNSTSGRGGMGGSTPANCEFTISKYASPTMPTVVVVEWSTTLPDVRTARIVYTLNGADSSTLNKGGTAPVDLTQANYRTLLLGLKQSSSYTFHIEVENASGTKCSSPPHGVMTGTLSDAPNIERTAVSTSKQAGGFIVTSSGQNGPGVAYIVDADGSVVWSAAGPNQCTRAHMDYEGRNVWMLSLNVSNRLGEMRYLSMDGQFSQNDVPGLSKTHHDFTVLPGGTIAAMAWAGTGTDPESELLERAADGNITSRFRIGSNLYLGGQSALGGPPSSFHCNYVVYHPADDTYTISDRNPNLVVKVSRAGNPIWQIGGSCTNAPAPKCTPGTWKINHGHDFDGNGNMLLFNNAQGGSAHVFEFKVTNSETFGITTLEDYNTTATSSTLGDVQRLPNGNTLITVSNAGLMVEVDAAWNTVQTLQASVGYAAWRESLYGPPTRK